MKYNSKYSYNNVKCENVKNILTARKQMSKMAAFATAETSASYAKAVDGAHRTFCSALLPSLLPLPPSLLSLPPSLLHPL